MKTEIRDQYLDILKKEVVGPEPSHLEDLNQSNGEEIIRGRVQPKSRYGAGILYPRQVQPVPEGTYIDEMDSMDETDETQTTDVDIDLDDTYGFVNEEERLAINGGFRDEQSSENTDDIIKMINAYKASAMGFSCILSKTVNEVSVTVDAALYKKETYSCKFCNDTGISISGDKKRCLYCKRSKSYNKEIDAFFRVPLQFTMNIDFKELLLKGRISKNLEVEDSEIPVLDELKPLGNNKGLRFSVVKRTSRLLDDDTVMVTFTLINENIAVFDEVKSNYIHKNSLCFFQTRFSVEIKNKEHCFIPMNINQSMYSELDKKINDLLYRNKPTLGIGHGCAISWDQDKPEQYKLTTESIPVFEMKKIDPQQNKSERFKDVDLSFFNLSDRGAADEIIITNLNALATSYEKWLDVMLGNSKSLSEKYKDTADHNIKKCKKALRRIKEGINLLEQDENSLKAFMLMNRAVLLQHLRSKQDLRGWKYENGYQLIEEYIDIDIEDRSTWPESIDYIPSWFPYQIAFILINIKSIIDPESDDRNNVECLWFPTGGGKTEAYLGLIGFTILYRRLKDPDTKGVSSVMRYTLRLLTAQQFQRASSLITACEYIRAQSSELFGNNNNRISIGLWVGGSLSPNKRLNAVKNYNNLMQPNNREENKLVVDKCPWCAAAMGKVEVFDVERDRKTTRTLGYKEHRSNGTRSVIYQCENGDCYFSNGKRVLPIYVVDEDLYKNTPDLVIGTVDKFARFPWDKNLESINMFRFIDGVQNPPDLIIQDELHLISGPLGSIVGNYETAIQTIFSKKINGKRIYPKIIASTATVSRASDQMNHLYNNRFDGEVFKQEMVNVFPHPVIDYNDSFFGKELSDSGQSRLYVGLNPTGYPDPKTAQVRIVSSLLQGVKNLNVTNEKDRDPYWTLLMYFNSIRELSGSSTLIDQDIIAYLKQIYNRKFPDSLENILNKDKKDRDWIGSNQRSHYPKKIELAARQVNDISEALRQLEIKYSDKNSKPVDVCLATNMISVGVDISRLGTMLVIGQPKTTSEYIQATSRVGRNYPGIVFVWYNNARPRDKSHFEQFISYHRKIYSMVEPTSITPFSDPVRQRALHAQVITLARYFGVARATDSIDQEIREKIKEILIAKVSRTDPNEVESTENEINKIFKHWKNYSNLTDWGNMSGYDASNEECFLLYPFGKEPPERMKADVFKTLTSMRNVDVECQGDIISGYE